MRVVHVERPAGAPLVLRLAPAGPTARGLRAEQAVAAPMRSALGPLVAETVAADFTHAGVDRDWLLQTLLPGRPASEVQSQFGPDALGHLYRELGDVARRVHAQVGAAFGPALGPGHARWSAALSAEFTHLAADVAAAGLPDEVHAQVRHLRGCVATYRDILDEVTEPRLLHGDLWTLNVLVRAADRPTITGIVDFDRAMWGDPLADSPLAAAELRAGTPADEFWVGYGPLPEDAATRTRRLLYRARNRLGARLDIERRGLDLSAIPPVHWDVTDLLAHLDRFDQ